MPENWKEQLSNLPRKTIAGCWYVELGSVETLIQTEIIERLIDDLPDKVLGITPIEPGTGKTMKEYLKAKWLAPEISDETIREADRLFGKGN